MKKISRLPPSPRRGDPKFAARADKFLAALPKFVTQMNALVDALNERDEKKAKRLEKAVKLVMIEAGVQPIMTFPGKETK